MNSTFFNQSYRDEERGEDDVVEALNSYFLANYLNTMVDKRCKSVSLRKNSDRMYKDEMVQCKKLMCALKRETHASSIIENSKFVDEVQESLSSLSDVPVEIVPVMTTLKNECEKSLNQLPLKGFQMLSPSQQVVMVQKLKGCDEVMKKYHDHFSQELPEKSTLAEHLEKILDPDLLPRKEKCDSLMEAIGNLSIEVSADVSAKTAYAILEKKDNVKKE